VARLLLARGADPTLHGTDGDPKSSPMFVADKLGRRAVSSLLRERMALIRQAWVQQWGRGFAHGCTSTPTGLPFGETLPYVPLEHWVPDDATAVSSLCACALSCGSFMRMKLGREEPVCHPHEMCRSAQCGLCCANMGTPP
jgi:hypothetical protein